MAKKLQRQIDNSFKAVAVMLPSPILNLGMDIPPVKAFSPGTYAKRGFLLKLEVTHRILGHKKWQRRFCILTRNKLFIYHNEMSNGCEKGTCYLDLHRFVRCQRIPSKHGNYHEFSLFGSSEESSNSIFKKNHSVTFGTSELTEVEDWILIIQQILAQLHQKIYNDSIYGFHRPATTTYGPTNSPGPSRQQHTHGEQIASNRTPEPFQRWNVIPNATVSKLENSSKKELTYSYSSSDEENDAESLAGSFGRPNVSNEAVTIKLTPRSIRSSKSKTVNQKIKKIPPLKSKEIDDIHLTELENKNDFNEIKTLQEEERNFDPTMLSELTSSSDITELATSHRVKSLELEKWSQNFTNMKSDLDNLKILSNGVSEDFKSTKNDIASIQENVICLQGLADGIEKKFQKFASSMKSTERQAAILLNDLRIKGELLERKITEVEQLKLRIINNVEGNSANSAHPNSAAAAPVADEVDQQGYQTFPKQKTPKSSKTPDRVIKQVSTSLKRSSNARHSVQICQDPSHQNHGQTLSISKVDAKRFSQV